MFTRTGNKNAASQSTASRRCAVALAVSAALGAGLVLCTGAGSAAAAVTDNSPSTTNVAYSGRMYQALVPSGVTEARVDAVGGDGGANEHTTYYAGPGGAAEVTGTVKVYPGEILDVYVGGGGANASTHDTDPLGGWSAPGYGGGNGNAASDYLRTSGAGGGATVIVDEQTGRVLLVAAGGGGAGGFSGDPENVGSGGYASTWVGGDGYHGSGGPMGGASGVGGAASTGQGGRGLGGSGLGGNGGGGGGGVHGGTAGGGAKGTSAGGGAGSGSSIADPSVVTDRAINAVEPSLQGTTDGQVTFTWL